MGGVSVEGGGGGGRKSVDQNVNMVPMIDLLISVIAFLLMTAVWVQTGALQASQPKRGGAPSDSNTPPKPKLQIDLAKDNYRVALTEGGDSRTITGENPEKRIDDLKTFLEERHKAMPQIDEVWLHPESDIRFEEIVQVMNKAYEVWGAEKKPEDTWASKVVVRFM